MKGFISRLFLTLTAFAITGEIISWFIIDPIYFQSINTYNEARAKSINGFYRENNTDHVDFLFIGSSRVPATINPKLCSELTGGLVINAGRGYMTPGIHYQALKNKIKNHPNFLQNSTVLIEYAGSDIYTSLFEDDMLKVYEPVVESDNPMPHLLLPHLDVHSFVYFLLHSTNSTGVKMQMIFLLSSSYRACQFIADKFNYYDQPLFQEKNNSLVSEGGIRNSKIEFANKKAIKVASQDKDKIINSPPLSKELIDKSSFCKLNEIVKNNGGVLMVYEMPLHSIQKNIYNSEKARRNKITFELWLRDNNIPIVYNPEFKYSDIDFPDTWHLSNNRRDEFTTKLCGQISKAQMIYAYKH